MDDMTEYKGKGSFAIRNWQEIAKGGGMAPTPTEIKNYLKGTRSQLSREELEQRVTNYLVGCMEMFQDEDSGSLGYRWKCNPTKSGLARAIGVSAETLSRYYRNEHDNMPYGSNGVGGRKSVVNQNDFDIIRHAYSVIEEFYESHLANNQNNAGSIFWLKNRDNVRWQDEKELTVTPGNQDTASKSVEQLEEQYNLIWNEETQSYE